jgi:hypothetical protein
MKHLTGKLNFTDFLIFHQDIVMRTPSRDDAAAGLLTAVSSGVPRNWPLAPRHRH